MKKILIFAFFILSSNYLALHSAKVFAQNEETTPSAGVLELPNVRILPDNPLYFLKTIKEKVQLLVTRNTSAQANLLLDFSQKRLAEALKVAEKGKVHISEKLFEAFGQDIKTAQEKIAAAKASGERTYELLVKLQETVVYQKEVIEELQIEFDQGLGATESGKMSPVKKPSGPGIIDWVRGLFGRKEILSPLAE